MIIPEYQIIEDKAKGDFIIQRYINSTLGWTYITTKPTREEAVKWITEGIIKK